MNVKTGKMPVLEDPRVWLVCPRCTTGGVVHMARDDNFRCKRCGAVFTADFVTKITNFIPKKETQK